MPYIKQVDREKLQYAIDNLLISIESVATNDNWAGILNYVFTKVLLETIPKVNYQNMAVAIGMLETAKLEFYRRLGEPYENVKIEENGDVYS